MVSLSKMIPKIQRAVALAAPERYIPVGQGFYVSSKEIDSNVEVTGGQIIFRNSQRVFVTDDQGEDGSIFKSKEPSKSKGKEAENRMMIMLKFHSPEGYNREILVGADPSTTEGFDLGYDSPLFDNIKEDMYWLINDQKFVIQGVPDFRKTRELALGIKTASAGEFTIEIEDLKNIPTDFEIYLKDSVTQYRYDLRDKKFKASDTAGIKNNRYYLVFQKITETDPGEGENPGETENPGEENPGESGGGGTPGEGESGEEGPGEGGGEVGGPEEGEPELNPDLELFYLHSDREAIIRNDGLFKLYQLRINNVLGQQVQIYQNLPQTKEVKIPLQGIRSGVYIILLDSEKGLLQKKIIVE